MALTFLPGVPDAARSRAIETPSAGRDGMREPSFAENSARRKKSEGRE